MLTTLHKDELEIIVNKRGDEVTKPKCILDYNKYMGAVDKCDMLYSSTDCPKVSKVLQKNIFPSTRYLNSKCPCVIPTEDGEKAVHS
jgi:hypothetical protein